MISAHNVAEYMICTIDDIATTVGSVSFAKSTRNMLITWYLYQDITYECIRAYYATVNSDEEDVILRKKGTVESEYDDDLDDGKE
jgi:hypothetical protein